MLFISYLSINVRICLHIKPQNSCFSMPDSQDKSAHSEVNSAVSVLLRDAQPAVNVLFQVIRGSNMETGEMLLDSSKVQVICYCT